VEPIYNLWVDDLRRAASSRGGAVADALHGGVGPG